MFVGKYPTSARRAVRRDSLEVESSAREQARLCSRPPPTMNRSQKAPELEKVLSQAKDCPHMILLAGHPDPDGIGSALAHHRICEHLGISSVIGHVLPLARSENRALVNLLSVPLTQVEGPADLEKFGYLSLVDASAAEASLSIPGHLKLLTVVDHHRPGTIPTAPFVDIRQDSGSTCAIYAEYMEQGLAPFDGTGADESRVATAMLFGIMTDTDDFSLATPADFRAAAYIKRFTDAATLSRIGRRTVSAEAMEAVSRALTNLEVVRDFALAGVGRVSAVNRDAIPTAADFILRREDIDTVLVYGLVDNRIDGSLRTNSASIDPATFMQNAFGKDPTGRYYGGGRRDKGGFQIPLAFFGECSDEESLWKLVREVVRLRVSREIPDIDRISRVMEANKSAG